MARLPRYFLPKSGFVGVDPGRSSGAIAYVSGSQAFTWTLKDKTDSEIWDVFRQLSHSFPTTAVLERVHSMPRQGVSSSFKFGSSYGELKMALVASQIRFELVTPHAWQTAMKCKTGGDKRVTRELAQRLFPELQITHQNADALLLAEYARRHLQ
jgi:Holliday junction resolvasome RuvABC endonuclease subunit